MMRGWWAGRRQGNNGQEYDEVTGGKMTKQWGDEDQNAK